MISLAAHITLLLTASLILLYLAYPLWLRICRKTVPEPSGSGQPVDGVSVILLSRNGGTGLKEKIDFLLDELRKFKHSELIVIDDNSTDESPRIINSYSGRPGVHFMLKNEQRGIPHSMNSGVELALFQNIVFCDQRQKLISGCLDRILRPLQNNNTGAVSGCISHIDKAHCKSIARIHENYLKSGESRTGNLIGVYGPMYAVKKSVYTPIPDDIILDDLYLSLKILPQKRIVMVKNCAITDERFSKLYDYSRSKRYLEGLMQILSDSTLLKHLNPRQMLMLFMHKFLRLVNIVLLFLVYIISAMMAGSGILFLAVFSMMTLIGIAVIAQKAFGFKSGFLDVIRINFYYLTATAELCYSKFSKMISIEKTKPKPLPTGKPESINI